jgi:hypothetical protein
MCVCVCWVWVAVYSTFISVCKVLLSVSVGAERGKKDAICKAELVAKQNAQPSVY